MTPQATAAEPGDINPNTRGSITIRKYENPTWANTVANGRPVTVPGGAKPISDVEFELHPIQGVDLTKPDGWTKIATMTPQQARMTTSGSRIQTTNASGETRFSDLPVGAYLVQEKKAPANVTGKVADFIVTIPHPSKLNENSVQWIYDVHVYPKNTVMPTPVKAVNDTAAFSTSDDVVWTVRQLIPSFPSDDVLRRVVLTDVLPPSLEYVNVSAMDEGSSVNVDASYEPNSRTLTAAVGASTPGRTITWTIRTRAKAPGVISNTATVAFNHDRGPSQITSNTVTTSWAALNVDKISSGGDGRLAGARFEIYRDSACTGQTVAATSQSVTTGANGAFPQPIVLKQGTYYLKEVQPPVGYVIPTSNCTRVDITAAANGTNDTAKIVQITNAKSAVPALPVTGANGELLLGVGGTAIALTGVGLAVLAARRRSLSSR